MKIIHKVVDLFRSVKMSYIGHVKRRDDIFHESYNF